jgi:putative peptidoglycan lipid II flippase
VAITKLMEFLTLWREHTNRSVNRKIFGAAVTIATLTAVTKVAVVVKELIVAWRFGTGDNLDAFLIASLIPALGINVIANSFSSALIPTYILVRESEGPEAAQKILSGITAWSLALLSLATMILILGAKLYLPWLASGFAAQKLQLTFDLICVMAPIVLFSGLANIWGAVLNAAERFALVALSPIITPSVTVIFLLLLKPWGIFALATGALCGACCEMVVLGGALKLHGISLRPRWYGFSDHLRQVVTQFSPRVAASLLRSGSTVADRAFASMLPSGNVAALSYGNRVTGSVVSIAELALGAAIVPYYSKMVAHRDWKALRHTLKRYLLLLLVLSIPVVTVLFVFSRPIVEVVYQRGSFTASDTQLVAKVQALYALQIPFFVGNILVARLLASLLATHITMWAAAIHLLITIALDLIFIRLIGLPGIALTASCAASITLLFVLSHSVRILGKQK